jgi:hypothetical protein
MGTGYGTGSGQYGARVNYINGVGSMSGSFRIARPFRPWIAISLLVAPLLGAAVYANQSRVWEEKRLQSDLSEVQHLLVSELGKSGGNISLLVEQYRRGQTKNELRLILARLSEKNSALEVRLAGMEAGAVIFRNEISTLRLQARGLRSRVRNFSYRVSEPPMAMGGHFKDASLQRVRLPVVRVEENIVFVQSGDSGAGDEDGAFDVVHSSAQDVLEEGTEIQEGKGNSDISLPLKGKGLPKNPRGAGLDFPRKKGTVIKAQLKINDWLKKNNQSLVFLVPGIRKRRCGKYLCVDGVLGKNTRTALLSMAKNGKNLLR